MNTSTAVVSTLIHVNQLLNFLIFSPIFDRTARQKWMRGDNVGLQKWGTFIPVFTNIACIGGYLIQPTAESTPNMGILQVSSIQ